MCLNVNCQPELWIRPTLCNTCFTVPGTLSLSIYERTNFSLTYKNYLSAYTDLLLLFLFLFHCLSVSFVFDPFKCLFHRIHVVIFILFRFCFQSFTRVSVPNTHGQLTCMPHTHTHSKPSHLPIHSFRTHHHRETLDSTFSTYSSNNNNNKIKNKHESKQDRKI